MKLLSGLAAVALAATTLAPTAASAAAPAPTKLASDWIATQLTDGIAVGSFADIGLTIDAGLTYDALGDSDRAAFISDSIASTLVTSADFPYGYVRSDEGGTDGRYANATAKAAAFTERIGRDARTAYSSIDLIDQLEDLTDDTTGLIADDSIYGQYENVIGQAFAMEALTRAGSGEAAAATDALLSQQCAAGYFLFTLGSTDCSTVPSADDTALAVISLIESGSDSARVRGAVALATQWLESVQRPNGSFAGDASAPGENSNSTALAGWALGEAGRTASATRAAAWTRGLQAADPGSCATQAPTGAIAYDVADLAAGRSGGITGNATVRDKWRRATFQSAAALKWAPAATGSLGISAPASAAASGKVDTVVRGVAAGEQACVTFGSTKRLVTGTGSEMTVSFDLPAIAPATHTFSVTTLAGTQSATTAVPAAPAPAKPVVGDLAVAKVEKVVKNRFTLSVACDAPVACAGTIKVRSAGKVKRANGKKRTLLVAKKAYSVAPGATADVRLKLTKAARSALGTQRLRVVAVQRATGAEPASTKFWLRRK